MKKVATEFLVTMLIAIVASVRTSRRVERVSQVTVEKAISHDCLYDTHEAAARLINADSVLRMIATEYARPARRRNWELLAELKKMFPLHYSIIRVFGWQTKQIRKIAEKFATEEKELQDAMRFNKFGLSPRAIKATYKQVNDMLDNLINFEEQGGFKLAKPHLSKEQYKQIRKLARDFAHLVLCNRYIEAYTVHEDMQDILIDNVYIHNPVIFDEDTFCKLKPFLKSAERRAKRSSNGGDVYYTPQQRAFAKKLAEEFNWKAYDEYTSERLDEAPADESRIIESPKKKPKKLKSSFERKVQKLTLEELRTYIDMEAQPIKVKTTGLMNLKYDPIKINK